MNTTRQQAGYALYALVYALFNHSKANASHGRQQQGHAFVFFSALNWPKQILDLSFFNRNWLLLETITVPGMFAWNTASFPRMFFFPGGQWFIDFLKHILMSIVEINTRKKQHRIHKPECRNGSYVKSATQLLSATLSLLFATLLSATLSTTLLYATLATLLSFSTLLYSTPCYSSYSTLLQILNYRTYATPRNIKFDTKDGMGHAGRHRTRYFTLPRYSSYSTLL